MQEPYSEGYYYNRVTVRRWLGEGLTAPIASV